MKNIDWNKINDLLTQIYEAADIDPFEIENLMVSSNGRRITIDIMVFCSHKKYGLLRDVVTFSSEDD